jgi:uncharacterized membrane protein SirB2
MPAPDFIAPLYPLLRHAHMGLVGLSVGLFALRWLSVLVGLRWPMQRSVRVLSMTIDTGLLVAGATLWWLLQINPLVQTWLGFKLLLLVAYVVLGTFALKRARSWLGKLVCGALALAVVAHMVAMALTRQPKGWLPL